MNSSAAQMIIRAIHFLANEDSTLTGTLPSRTIGGTSARFGALLAGAVDATAVSSPYEYKAEQSGLRILVPFKRRLSISSCRMPVWS